MVLMHAAALLFINSAWQVFLKRNYTGRHKIRPAKMSMVSGSGSHFGADFWNTMAISTFQMYLDDLRIQVLNVALDASEIASKFIENVANQKLWILRGRIHESLGQLQAASDLYEYCISHFGAGRDLNEVMFRAAAVAKRLGRFTRCIAYMEYALINPPNGYSQTDVLFQVARVHEQEGKIDVASDGFRQAFKLWRQEGQGIGGSESKQNEAALNVAMLTSVSQSHGGKRGQILPRAAPRALRVN